MRTKKLDWKSSRVLFAFALIRQIYQGATAAEPSMAPYSNSSGGGFLLTLQN